MRVIPVGIVMCCSPWQYEKQYEPRLVKLIAVCDYEASYTPGPQVWNEGYPVWWHLTNVRLLKEPIPCRGNVGMWELP